MSEVENNQVDAVVETVETGTVDVNSEDLKQELERLRKQNRELLHESKQKKKALEAVEKDKAAQTGEYEKLWKSAESEKESVLSEYNEFKNKYKSEKINNQAMSLANKMAIDSDAAIALTEFVSKSLSKLADENGNISDDVIESVKKEVTNNKAYARLVAGSKASGSGAPGAGSRATGVKEMSMPEYDKLDPMKKLEFSRMVQAGKARLI